ncbi:MAG TPA: hypothetical protein VEP50_11720 [bacterium]|nr:hypothetical protein [bacterium]
MAPTQPQVPVTPAAPPRPTPPAQPTPVPSDQFLVLPGKAIGSVTLGMRVQDLPAALGQPANRVQNPDGTTELYWYGPPLNRGIGVLVTKTGMVVRAWVLNDSRFITLHNLHIGSTEAEVRAALGTPTSTSVNAKQGVKALLYNQIGMWFFIQLNQNYNFYNQVFEIGILGR